MKSAPSVTPDITTALSWADYGLFGLVVGALFVTVFYLLKVNKEERSETRKLHQTERAEWRQSSKETHDSLSLVIKEMTVAIRDLEKKAN